MKKLRIYFFILLFVLIFNNLSGSLMNPQGNNKEYIKKMWEKNLEKYPLPKNAKELELRFSFPKDNSAETDVFFWKVQYMNKSDSGNMYVSDNKENCIYIFDELGNFIKKFGQKGQAPGELSMPSGVLPLNDIVVVNDIGNNRIQFFNLDGKFQNSRKMFKSYFDLVVSEKGLIYAAPLRVQKNDPLIDVLDFEGHVLRSFGEGLDFKNWQQLNQIKLAINKKGELFIAFVYFPKVRKYSVSGKLLAEFTINQNFMKLQEKINFNALKSNSKGKKRTGFVKIIDTIKATDNSFYILHCNPRIEIMEYTTDGNLLNHYWNLGIPSYYAYDLIIHRKDNEKLFYVLQRFPSNKIDVFGQK